MKKVPVMCQNNNEQTVVSEKVLNMPKNDDPIVHGCFSPARPTFRYIGMILMCLLNFGSFFCYDNPGALQNNIETDLGISSEKFVMLYSIYSWPNIISCVIGGFLLDRVFGIRWGTFIYVVILLIGHIIFAVAAFINSFWLMMIGRFLFGIGGESLMVALDSYTVLWFKGKELNMVFGMQLCFDNIATTTNFLIMESVYSYVSNILNYAGPKRIGIALFIAAITCVASVACAMVLGVMDVKAEKVLRRNENRKVETMKLRSVKDFGTTFWLISVICVAYSVTIYPFISLAKVYFITKYELAPSVANTVTSLMYTISAVLCPLFGILVDKTGKNILWIIAGIVGTILAHGLLAFTYVSPYVSMFILGLSYSLFESSFWSVISLIVLEHQMGTAYGIVGTFLNLGLAVVPIICGIIVKNYGYFLLEMFFLFCLFISLVTAVTIWIEERKATAIYSVNE